MTSKIILFAFGETLAHKVLNNLQVEDKYVLESTKEDVIKLVDIILKRFPKYIIGIGDYSGRDIDKIRLETRYTNKFRNQINGGKLQSIEIKPYVTDSPHIKISNRIGNSFCNLVSYNVVKRIHEEQIQTKYMFFHIPKSFPLSLAIKEVNSLIFRINETA